MSNYYVFPDQKDTERMAGESPDHMYPHTQPYAVVHESFLTPRECDNVFMEGLDLEAYRRPGCHAITREFDRPIPSSLRTTANLMRRVNEQFWKYVIDWSSTTAWLQSYYQGDQYHAHTDDFPGVSRKLTAVLFLTDSSDYTGGNLVLKAPNDSLAIDPPRGTVVMFKSTMWHEVRPIFSGFRATVNIGFFGPPLR